MSGDAWEWLGLDAPSAREMVRAGTRLLLATVLAGAVGFERERAGKTAGLRTHMLVGLGSAAFTMAIVESGGGADALSRVIQGIATGIGFVGAGAILKPDGSGQVKGLTTATGVWMVAALGACVGAGRFWLPLMATVVALVVMAILGRFERSWTRRADS